MGYRSPEAAWDPLPRDRLVHPRPAALGLARVQIQVKPADEPLVGVDDSEKTHVRMPGSGEVRKNANAIEGFDEPEHAFQDLLLREIPLHFLIGKRVAFRAQFLRCERDIPGLQLLDSFFFKCDLPPRDLIPSPPRPLPR